MVDIVESNDIRLIFIVPASNEKDFSPFKSQLCNHLTSQTRRQWFRLFEQGLARKNQGDHDTALDFFNDSKEIDSCYADLRYQIGQTYLALGQFREAKREFVYARDLDIVPLRAISQIQSIVREVAIRRDIPIIDLASLLETQIQKSSGHAILGNEAFLDHVHPTIQIHQMLAEELTKISFKEDWIKPERLLQQSRIIALYDSVMVTLDTNYHATKDLNLAKVLSWLGKSQEAAPFVLRASKALPNHPEAQYLKGILFQNDGEFPLAEESYKKAITLDSTFFRAYHALASVYEITEQWDKAIAVITHAVRYQPESAEAYFSLGNSLYKTGQKSKAVEAYQKAIKFNPRHSKAFNNLAAVHITEGNYNDAITALEKTLKLEPKNINAYKNLGLSHYHRGKHDQSRRMFERVLDLRPNDDYATKWLIRLNQERKQ
jgi:tetratricopeptide (TPR) repeat protein